MGNFLQFTNGSVRKRQGLKYEIFKHMFEFAVQHQVTVRPINPTTRYAATILEVTYFFNKVALHYDRDDDAHQQIQITSKRTWNEHISVSSTDIMAPALSNSPQ